MYIPTNRSQKNRPSSRLKSHPPASQSSISLKTSIPRRIHSSKRKATIQVECCIDSIPKKKTVVRAGKKAESKIFFIITIRSKNKRIFGIFKSYPCTNNKRRFWYKKVSVSPISTDLGYQYFTIIFPNLEATLCHKREHFSSYFLGDV